MTLLLTTDRRRFADYTRETLPLAASWIETVEARLGAGDPSVPRIPEPARGEIVRYFDYVRWPVRRMEYSFALRALGCAAARGPVAGVLDVGSGPSVFPAMVASKLGCPVTCVERDPGIVEAMRSLALPRCEYVLSDMGSLPFDDRSFDAVTCVSVLEHVHRESGLEAISEMLRVTRDGGVVVLTVDYRSLPPRASARKWLTRLARAAAYLARGRAAALLRAATSPRPYDSKDLERLSSAFARSVIGGPQRSWGRLDAEEVAAFWSAHREPGLACEPGPRDYASVGILLSRDPLVREAMAGCAGLPR